MLDPVHLRTLRAVLRTGSFAAAAVELRYTPSAVSQQIAALERSCGLALFERLPHRIVPSAAALRLADRAADLLSDLAAAEREMTALARGEAGQIRVGAFPTAGARIVPAALAELTRTNPRVDVALDEGEPAELEAALLRGDLDVAVLYRYDLVPGADHARLGRVHLIDEPLYLLTAAGSTAPAGSSRAALRISALRAERWVAPLPGSAGGLNLERLCAAARFTPRIAFRSNDYSVVRGLVGAGLGVALIPALAVVPDDAVRVHALAGRRGTRRPGRRVFAAHRRSDRNPLLTPVLAALTSAVAAGPDPWRVS